MARAIIECRPSEETLKAVRDGWADYHRSVEEHGPADEWDKQVIDQCIRAFVKQGKPFSANDMRPLLPEVRKCLISRRLIAAQNQKLIRYVGITPSSLESTKSASVNVYAPIRPTNQQEGSA